MFSKEIVRLHVKTSYLGQNFHSFFVHLSSQQHSYRSLPSCCGLSLISGTKVVLSSLSLSGHHTSFPLECHHCSSRKTLSNTMSIKPANLPLPPMFKHSTKISEGKVLADSTVTSFNHRSLLVCVSTDGQLCTWETYTEKNRNTEQHRHMCAK